MKGKSKYDGKFVEWGWEKKPRTMIRFIKPGDIFCFEYNGKYLFGRIITEINGGNTAEIFDIFSDTPELPDITNANRLIPPQFLDSYSIFDRKTEGEWRIIGHQNDFVPVNIENVFFVYGLGTIKKVDIWDGNEEIISEEEAKKYPRYSPLGKYHIFKEIDKALQERQSINKAE